MQDDAPSVNVEEVIVNGQVTSSESITDETEPDPQQNDAKLSNHQEEQQQKIEQLSSEINQIANNIDCQIHRQFSQLQGQLHQLMQHERMRKRY